VTLAAAAIAIIAQAIGFSPCARESVPPLATTFARSDDRVSTAS
jgi:hypothetical protein